MNSQFCRSQNGAFLYHQNLAPFKWLAHGFSLRSSARGGFEQSLGFNGYQSREVVQRNRQHFVQGILKASTGSREAPTAAPAGGESRLIVPRQGHTDIVHVLTAGTPAEFSADGDGLVTNQLGLLLGVLTADCMPVLLADVENHVVAAVHAGWRGTAKRIVEKALGIMQNQFGSRPQHCIAVVGAAIRGCCYEVGEDVVGTFHGEFDYASQLFRIGPEGKWFLDLPAACRFQLLHAGLEANNVFADPACTSCNLEHFFSHRAERGKTGRMIGVIGILAGP
jgi:purine-nucleoside/S-methyl-5'-thioadenosine phosphorylase / adenosine deaminase